MFRSLQHNNNNNNDDDVSSQPWVDVESKQPSVMYFSDEICAPE